jgi:hypothetical protein
MKIVFQTIRDLDLFCFIFYLDIPKNNWLFLKRLSHQQSLIFCSVLRTCLALFHFHQLVEKEVFCPRLHYVQLSCCVNHVLRVASSAWRNTGIGMSASGRLWRCSLLIITTVGQSHNSPRRASLSLNPDLSCRHSYVLLVPHARSQLDPLSPHTATTLSLLF